MIRAKRLKKVGGSNNSSDFKNMNPILEHFLISVYFFSVNLMDKINSSLESRESTD